MGANDEVALLHETAGLVVGVVVATWLGAASGVDELAFVLERTASANDTAASYRDQPDPTAVDHRYSRSRAAMPRHASTAAAMPAIRSNTAVTPSPPARRAQTVRHMRCLPAQRAHASPNRTWRRPSSCLSGPASWPGEPPRPSRRRRRCARTGRCADS